MPGEFVTKDIRLHPFRRGISGISLPEKLNSPYRYRPHPICLRAAAELQEYLAGRKDWQEELSKGKMFGVLAVRDQEGHIGWLAAFSGMLADSNEHSFFVSPVYDLQAPQGFFKPEEKEISALNVEISRLEKDSRYARLADLADRAGKLGKEILEKKREEMAVARARREICRKQANEREIEALVRESQYQKASFKRLKRHWQSRMEKLQAGLENFRIRISALKEERKRRSAALQARLFTSFRLMNAKGEEKDVVQLFREAGRGLPPAGTGECAAPRLLQHAFRHGYRPLSIAEFWWGKSPRTEIRRHGNYYPSCREKCEPLLAHMLSGLDVEDGSFMGKGLPEVRIVYADRWLAVVDKPAGLLSVPGKSDQDSVYAQCRRLFPDAGGPLLVHRLDMSTSGLLLIARDQDIYKELQAQFCHRSVRKVYIALLEGIPREKEGCVYLPLCPNPEERPRQMVNREYGKAATTYYQVLEIRGGRALVRFEPLTGRTHQIRIHAAHPEGLDCPIRGDELYGQPAERLFLHATGLIFHHPVTGEQMEFRSTEPDIFHF